MKAAYLKPFLVAAIIILVDQIIKTWVRTHMDFNSEIHFLGRYGMLRYTENNGMAFIGKLVCSTAHHFKHGS